MEPVSVLPTFEDNAEPISIDTSNYSPPVPPEIAARRAEKADLGGLTTLTGKDQETVKNQIIQGDEGTFRQEAATAKDQSNAQKTYDLITQAAAKGPIEPSWLASVIKPRPTDPATVIEQNWAREFLRPVTDLSDPFTARTFMPEAMAQIPEHVQATVETGSDLIAKSDYFRKRAEEAAGTLADQSYAGWGLDQLKQFLPGYSQYMLRGNTDQTSFWTGLLGTNLEDQRQELWNLPLDQAKAKYEAIISRLQAHDPGTAMQFAQAMVGQGSEDIAVNNAFSAIDIGAIGGLGKTVLSKAGLFNMTRNAVRNAVKSALGDDGNLRAAMAEGQGNLAEAAVLRASKGIVQDFQGQNPTLRIVEPMISGLRADRDAIKDAPGNLSREGLSRLIESTNRDMDTLVENVTNIQRVNRIPALLATEDGVRTIQESTIGRYPGLSNTVLDMSNVLWEPITNTYSVDYALGTKNAELFTRRAQAATAARMRGLADYEIEQSGNGFYIRLNKEVKETDSLIRDGLLKTVEAETPDSWAKGVVSWFRTPEETLSLDNRMNRKILTYGPANLMKVTQDSFKEIRAIAGVFNKKKWDNFERTLEAGRSMMDEETGRMGKSFKDPGELSDFYLRNFGYKPDDAETQAYFAFKRVNEVDRQFRIASLYKFKSRMGAESHRIIATKDGEVVRSPWFDGVIKDKLASGAESSILYVDGDVQKVYNAGIHGEQYKKLSKGVEEGSYKAIEVFAPQHRPLRGFGKLNDERIQYVVTKNAETRRLQWNDQVPRTGGGHFDYDYQHYLKQANIGQQGRFTWYEGDRTIAGLDNRAMGTKIAKTLNDIRERLRARDVDGARTIAEDPQRGLPWSFEEIHAKFKPGRDNEGNVIKPAWAIDQDFHVVPSNKMVIDMPGANLKETYGKTFKDGTKEGSLLSTAQVQYTGERDAYEVHGLRDIGTRNNPDFTLERAKMLDPIPTINRALSRIVNSTYLDDYKLYSVEHWLQEAMTKGMFTVKEDMISHSPFFYFLHAEDYMKKGIDFHTLNQMMANRFKIRQLLGIPSKFETFLHDLGQGLADSIYRKVGPTGLSVARASKVLDPSWVLPTLADGPRLARSIAFHEKLGLFAVPQLLVQGMTYTNIVGIAGASKAGPGLVGAILHQFSRVNQHPNVIDHFDKLATKMFAFKPGEWKEAFTMLNNSGFNTVSGEHAMLDNPLSNKFTAGIANKWDNFLDLGAIFFREGERNTRYAAWYTAFKEFRKANPTGAISEYDKAKILERAALLNHNMDRSSSSILHTGVMSIPGQFMAYPLRLFELMTGSRLTALEKARLFGTSAVLYGLPAAASLYGFPLGDIFRKHAEDGQWPVVGGKGPWDNYVVGDNFVKSVIMEGLPSMVMASITGGGDYKKGHFYNIGDRYGSKGFETLTEMMRTDKTMWDIFGGAAGGTLANTWANTDGFRRSIMSFLKQDGQYPMTTANVIDAAKEITSVNNAWRLQMAINTGKWVSKTDAPIDDVTAKDALFQSVTGLSHQELSDLNLKTWSLEDQKNSMKATEKLFDKYFRRAMLAASNSDPEEWKSNLTSAFSLLEAADYPIEKRGQLIGNAGDGNRTLIDKINWDFAMKNVPPSMSQSRMQMFQKIQQLKQKRQQ